MPGTFSQYFDEVCAVEYGLKPVEMSQLLAGEYYGTGKPNDLGRFSLEVIWRRREIGAVAGLVRNIILPESIDLYAKDNDIDITVGEAVAMGNIAITSASLTEAGMLGIVEARMPLRPFESRPASRIQ